MEKLVTQPTKNTQFYFNLKGKVIIASEMYEAKAIHRNGIKFLKENAPLDKCHGKKISTQK